MYRTVRGVWLVSVSSMNAGDESRPACDGSLRPSHLLRVAGGNDVVGRLWRSVALVAAVAKMLSVALSGSPLSLNATLAIILRFCMGFNCSISPLGSYS